MKTLIISLSDEEYKILDSCSNKSDRSMEDILKEAFLLKMDELENDILGIQKEAESSAS